jgi:hypothetical protein
LSGTSATVYGEAFAKIYRGRQAGGIVGLFSAGTITEYMGTKNIGPIVTRGLTGQVAGVGVKGAYKTGFGVAKQTIPRFIGLGIYEGVVSAATAKQAQRRSLFMAPEEYLIGGVAGGISAPLLGAPVIGFGAARAIKAGRSPVARTAGIVTRATGSILDVYEYPTDIAAAKIFGLPEPSFRIVPGKGKIVTRAGRIRVRTPVTIGILQPSSIADFTGISTIIPSVSPKTTTPTPTTPTPIIPTPIPPIPTPTPTPIITITPTPSETTTNIFGDEITTTTNINTFIGTPISVPITTPIARAGLPALFPVSPFGEGGAGRRGKGRTTFLNEFLFARSLLGTTLAKRGQKIVKERKLAFGLKQPKRKKGKSLFGIRLFKSRGKRK